MYFRGMKYIAGQNREQVYIFPVSLDEAISQSNEVRIIDEFVNSLPLVDYGFKLDCIENGRPAYHPADLLKIYLYGYLNKTRSSRDLEKECHRNIELMWLLKGLKPDHNTISNFRRDNPEGIKQVFRATVSISKFFKLIGGKLLAGDSTKLRAQNSKKNNYNQSKITKHIEYIDKKLEEYSKILATEDGDKEDAKKQIKKHETRKEKYHQLENQLKETNQEQISTSDPESRQIITRNNITEVAYNIQTTVDAENCILIDYETTNNNDSKAMGYMAERATKIIGTTDITMLYDKGYHTGSELKIAQELGITTLVAVPDVASNASDPSYNIANFKYTELADSYICPQKEILKTNGNWYTKNRGKHRSEIQVKQYKTTSCKSCSCKHLCTKSPGGRVLERSEYAQYIEQNKLNLLGNEFVYKRRQSIVEHPYGTIKRQWGFSYILTKKTMKRASADVGIILTAYNLRRLINILGIKVLIKYLKVLASFILAIFRLFVISISHPISPKYFTIIRFEYFFNWFNRTIFD